MKSIELDAIRSAKYDANIDAYGEGEDTCICCGKRTKGARYIQMTTAGFLVDAEDELPDSQGCFPIGRDGYKKFEQSAT